MTDLLANLNAEQLKAVTHGDGPLLVFAGAGSGKTRVLTHRIAWLLQQGKARPGEILAVTFTNKAAREMKTRIEGLLGERGASEVWAGTFHSTCAKLLRISGEKIGLDRNFVIFDDDDQIRVIKEVMREMNLSEKNYPARALLSQISHQKEQLRTPQEYLAKHSGLFEETVAKVWKQYSRKLQDMRGLDFDDLIVYAVRLLQERSDVREQYQRKFKYVLVDEYQDINLCQFRLVEIIASRHGNIMVVGDDDQSIYSWRGADISIILDFEKHFPNATVIKLEQNYRSTQIILDAANEVVSGNTRRTPKKLWTNRGAGKLISLWEAVDEIQEAEMVASFIDSQLAAGRTAADFAVLYRTNAQSRPFEEVFMRHKLPYRIIGGVRFWERKEIKDIIGYLRLVANDADNVSFNRIVNVPTRGIGGTSLEKIQKYAAAHQMSQLQAARTPEALAELQPRAARSVTAFVGLIDQLRFAAQTMTVSDLAAEVLKNSGYLRDLENERTVEAGSRIENLEELISAATMFDTQADDSSLEAFLAQVALVSDVDSLEDASDAILLMTLHTAKGLEFPVVVLSGLEEGIFPHSRSLYDPTQLEEERRLCYVGMTRARDELYITYAFRRMSYGTSARSVLSRFVKEIPSQYFESALSSVAAASSGAAHLPKPSIARSADCPFAEGDKVVHDKFGKGVVISSQGAGDEAQVTVMFAGQVGLKKLLLAYAKLQKAPNGASAPAAVEGDWQDPFDGM